MIETIADIRKRYVFSPKLPSYYMPHAKVIDPIQRAYDKGFNDCLTILKAVGKI